MSTSVESVDTDNNDTRALVWFDIDNTLYSASTKIAQAMGERIHDDEAASELHFKYYTQYGLALRGLTRHHQIGKYISRLRITLGLKKRSTDPIDFDRKCDGSLPLEEILSPNPKLRQLLSDIDRSKARVWALTNAYKTHAKRVLDILDLSDQFEGTVFCDYAQDNFVCKPEPDYYEKALKTAGFSDLAKCYFVDDNKGNVLAAKRLGWGHCVHFCEHGLPSVEGGKETVINNARSVGDEGIISVTNLEELRDAWPEVFKR